MEGLEPASKNIGSGDHSADGGNHSGNIEPISDQYAAFCTLLNEWGFTGTQLVLISDALQEAGLEIRPTTADC